MARPGQPVLVGVCLLLVACGGLNDLELSQDAPPRDAGVKPPPLPAAATLIREDFDNLRQVAELGGEAVIDVNRGVATLPVYTFPTIDGTGTNTYAEDVVVNDLLQAGTIKVETGVAIEVPDSVELRAADTITVLGQIRAGPGGVILAARSGIYIELGALIESEGPIQLLLGDSDGEIRIDGEVISHAFPENQLAASISVVGRGRLSVTGRVITYASMSARSGDVFVGMDGDIEIAGRMARVAATAETGGTPGGVTIHSDGVLRVLAGAAVGTGNGYASIDGELGGGLVIKASAIEIADGCTIAGGRSVTGGAVVAITAAERLILGPRAILSGGFGAIGGGLVVMAREINLADGSLMTGGNGESSAGDVNIETASSILIEGAATIAAGDTACGDGAKAKLDAGGLIQATGPGAVIRGGHAGNADSRCIRSGKGGDLQIQAAQFLGLEGSLRGGDGEPPGAVTLVSMPAQVERPDPALGRAGSVTSKLIDRGVKGAGRVPRLLGLRAETPPKTKATVFLCGVVLESDPCENWLDVGDPAGAPLASFADARYFKYRVELEGRPFDAPVLNYFEIDLAPE